MEQMMSGGMWGMSFIALMFLVVAVLGIAALVKFLFFR